MDSVFVGALLGTPIVNDDEGQVQPVNSVN